MGTTKKNLLSEEHLRKIKYRIGYSINESPRYQALENDNDEFDTIPVVGYATEDGQPVPQSQSFSSIYEAGEQEDSPTAQEKDSREPTNAEEPNIDEPNPDSPTPAFDDEGDDLNEPEQPMGDVELQTNPQQQVDGIQNEIIKHNIEAMKSIHTELESLNSMVQTLNNKLGELNADVEEVREPTNVEKLMKKTEVSFPFSYNLNDLWKDNWFEKRREEEIQRGIRKLPDGTYVADLDDLPQKSKIDIQNSFNEFI